VIRTVREYEKSGVAGFHIEDQVSPQEMRPLRRQGSDQPCRDGWQDPRRGRHAARFRCRHYRRSDARDIEGLQAAIDRVNAYLEAGADVGFVEAPQNVEELRIVGRQVRGPALVNVFEGGKTLPPRRSIDAAPTGHLVYLVTAFGQPHSVKGFGTWFKKRCREAGIEDLSAHGLRKLGALRRSRCYRTSIDGAVWVD
jgi:2-methylisocitrate lyase-like PEP mutase family enzyme